ncbi:MAG: ankyrin repeat domain-containing protein [Proteobacteria bacterium]|nr:ankyrin repeat domain-containing protein [Pseudomonadota bacterium]
MRNLQEQLFDAANGGRVGTVRELLSRGVDPNVAVEVGDQSFEGNEMPLHRAAMKGHLEVCVALIAAGASVEAESRWHHSAEEPGDRPLHAALHEDHLAIVELLLLADADANAAGYLGHTPAHEGLMSIDPLISLKRHGADFNAMNDAGDTVLAAAVRGGFSYAVCEWLLANGADPRLVDPGALVDEAPSEDTFELVVKARGETLGDWIGR